MSSSCCYSGINGTAERKHCLDLAREYGLEVPMIVKLVVETIRDMDSDELFMNTDVCGETSTTTVSCGLMAYAWGLSASRH